MVDLSGKVTDAYGGVSGATVVVLDTSDTSPDNWTIVGTAITDSNGDWLVDGLTYGKERYHAVVQYQDGDYYNAYSKPFLTAQASYPTTRDYAMFHGISHNAGETGELISSASLGSSNSYSYITDDQGENALRLTHTGNNSTYRWGAYWGPIPLADYDSVSFRYNHTRNQTWTDQYFGISEQPVGGENPTIIRDLAASGSNRSWTGVSGDVSDLTEKAYFMWRMVGSPNGSTRQLEGALSQLTFS